MVYFDQGRTVLAAALVEKLDVSGCADASALGEYYNLMGLLVYREIRQCRQDVAAITAPAGPDAYAMLLKITAPANPEAYTTLLDIAAHYYHQSLALHTGVGDYHAMQGTCSNLGNLFLYAWTERLTLPEGEQLLELGMKWVVQCEFICNKFGVGMDSVRSRIALIKIAMGTGFGMEKLNTLTGDIFRNHASLEEMARATLAEAQAIGNRLEQAEMFAILMRLALGRADHPYARVCRNNVLTIYRELKREDLARPFKVALPEAEHERFIGQAKTSS